MVSTPRGVPSPEQEAISEDHLGLGARLTVLVVALGSSEFFGEGKIASAVPATAAPVTIRLVSVVYEGGERFDTDRVRELASDDVDRLEAGEAVASDD